MQRFKNWILKLRLWKHQNKLFHSYLLLSLDDGGFTIDLCEVMMGLISFQRGPAVPVSFQSMVTLRAANWEAKRGGTGMELCSCVPVFTFTALSYTSYPVWKAEGNSVLWSAHYLLVFVCALCCGAPPVKDHDYNSTGNKPSSGNRKCSIHISVKRMNHPSVELDLSPGFARERERGVWFCYLDSAFCN